MREPARSCHDASSPRRQPGRPDGAGASTFGGPQDTVLKTPRNDTFRAWDSLSAEV